MNKLLKIVFVFVFFSFTNIVSASFYTNLKLDKKEVALDDSFHLIIKVTWSWNIDNVTARWIDEFSIFWKKESKSITVINWKREENLNIIFTLKPKNKWDFELWPVVLRTNWKDNIWKEILSLNVWDKSVKADIIKEEIKKEIKETKIIENKPIVKSDDSEVKKESPNELNDIDKNKSLFSWFNFFYVFVILFFIIFYFVINYLLWNRNKEKKEIENNKPKMGQDIIIKLKLEKLKKNIKNLNKAEFYSVLNLLFREYFEFLWIEKASKMTYKELNETTLKDEKIFSVFKKSYYSEFDKRDDNKDSRKDLINKFIKRIEKDLQI